MTFSGAHAVPWHAVVPFHREALRHTGAAFFALPVGASTAEHWSSLAGFEPGRLDGPWELDFQVLASPGFQQAIRSGLNGAYIGGPCWFRWTSGDEPPDGLQWIPLIYREVSLEARDDRLRVIPSDDGWAICPLVFTFLEQHKVQTVGPLQDMLPDLLSRAESKAAEDARPLTRTLAEAFGLVALDLGKELIRARNDFPADKVEQVPSPWVLFSASAGPSSAAQRILHDYARLERHLASFPQDVGGLGLLGEASSAAMQKSPNIIPIVPLNERQRFALEAALDGRPVTVISGPPGSGKGDVLASLLFNAWASSTSVLLASHSEQTVEAVSQRLESFASDIAFTIRAGEPSSNAIDAALGRTIDLITARRGESHYGGSLSERKHGQLIKKKQKLRELIDGQVPERLSQAIKAALESQAAHREALAALETRREELRESLRSLGIEEDADAFREQVLEPLRKWRDGIHATRRLIKEDAQRSESLQRELASARSDRDSALADCQIDDRSDEALTWLLAEPGFRSFERAMAALAEKLEEPIEDVFSDSSWDATFDAWSSSQTAADWERQARELAALMRPAGISLKEKTEEVRAARAVLDSAQSTVQQVLATANVDIRREDVDEWAACYAELCTLPPAKLKLFSKSKSADLIQRLEVVESRLRITFPVHIWTTIGALNENGRRRLAPIIERACEWARANEDWDRLGTVREEIESETDALRRKLNALGEDALASEVTPAACGSIASKLLEKAALAKSAADAWLKREARERLPAELADLGDRIRAAGAGTPIKERWIGAGGAALMAAFESVVGNPGVETISAVRQEILGPAATDPDIKNWQKAYEAEHQYAALTEETARIPSRAVRLAQWNARRPGTLPDLEVDGAFDGDESHPLWTFLQEGETWSARWAAWKDEEAPALENTADAEGTSAIRRITEAAQALPKSKEKAWLESFANASSVSKPWPVDKMTELAGLWRPERLQAEIEKVDAQLERMTFESAREQWLDRVAQDVEVLQSLNALRGHYKKNRQDIDEREEAHFAKALKAQPVWITSPASARSIPMHPGLFDLLVVDGATRCGLTDLLPLIFRAKHLIVIGDPEQSASIEGLDAETEQTLAEQFGIEEWTEALGHAGNSVHKAAEAALPRRQAEVISLIDAEEAPASPGEQSSLSN